MIKAVNIKWDTDGDKEAFDSLPQEIEIPEGMDKEDVSDYISDETGFCHYGYELTCTLSEKIEKILEENDISVSSISDDHFDDEDDDYYFDIELETYSPEGEDVLISFGYNGSEDGFVDRFSEYAEDFDVDNHVEMYVANRGENGIPNSISDLVDDAKWIKAMLLKTAKELEGEEIEGEKFTEKTVEDQLFDFFNDKMMTGEASGIKQVKRYDDMFTTKFRGIVIDNTNGQQIRLTIHVD